MLALLAGGSVHGYAIVGELAGLGITNGAVDVGQVYRTLRDLEQAGQVRSDLDDGHRARPGATTSSPRPAGARSTSGRRS